MKRSELMARLKELFGDEDVDIYLDPNEESSLTDNFKIYIDGDGDAVIQP